MSQIDILQFRIIRELMGSLWMRRSKRLSYVELSEKIGCSPETARRTLRGMQKSGIIQTWNATINPHRLGMECVNMLVKCDPRIDKQETMKRLTLIDGVIRLFNFIDSPEIRILLYYMDRNDLERKVKVISMLCGEDPPSILWEANFPACQRTIRKTDWAIMKALLRNSIVTIPALAKELKISSRTVRRRLAQLEEDNSYFIYPTIDPKKVNGYLYLFFLEFSNPAEKRKAEHSLNSEIETMVLIDTSSTTMTILDVISSNVHEFNQIREIVENKSGLKSLDVKLLMDVVPAFDWLTNELERRTNT